MVDTSNPPQKRIPAAWEEKLGNWQISFPNPRRPQIPSGEEGPVGGHHPAADIEPPTVWPTEDVQPHFAFVVGGLREPPSVLGVWIRSVLWVVGFLGLLAVAVALGVGLSRLMPD